MFSASVIFFRCSWIWESGPCTTAISNERMEKLSLWFSCRIGTWLKFFRISYNLGVVCRLLVAMVPSSIITFEQIPNITIGWTKCPWTQTFASSHGSAWYVKYKYRAPFLLTIKHSRPYKCFQLPQFCQPCGWRLTTNRQAPTFFVAYLTGVDGSHYYAACLTFYEAVSGHQQHIIQHRSHGTRSTNTTDAHNNQIVSATSPAGSLSHLNSCESLAVASGNFNGTSVDPNLIRPTELFAPKCIVLLARHQHFKVLQARYYVGVWLVGGLIGWTLVLLSFIWHWILELH